MKKINSIQIWIMVSMIACIGVITTVIAEPAFYERPMMRWSAVLLTIVLFFLALGLNIYRTVPLDYKVWQSFLLLDGDIVVHRFVGKKGLSLLHAQELERIAINHAEGIETNLSKAKSINDLSGMYVYSTGNINSKTEEHAWIIARTRAEANRYLGERIHFLIKF